MRLHLTSKFNCASPTDRAVIRHAVHAHVSSSTGPTRLIVVSDLRL